MKATILPSGEVILESTTETRIIRPSHASYSALAELYRRLGGAAQSQANKFDPSKGKAEYALEPGYGGWPWKGGEPDYDEVYDIPLEAIHVDAERFQFKKGADDETGVTTELDDEAFDPDRCEPLGVWKDPRDGKTFVVDGHHRRELGERAGVESMRCQYIKADSAKEARKIGGAMNGVQLSQVHAPHTMAAPPAQPEQPAPAQPYEEEPEPEFPDADRSPDISPEDEEILRRIWNEPPANVALSAVHAPKGYTEQRPLAIQGKAYVGGEFIPGDVVANATPQEKAAMAGQQQPAQPPKAASMFPKNEEKVGDQKDGVSEEQRQALVNAVMSNRNGGAGLLQIFGSREKALSFLDHSAKARGSNYRDQIENAIALTMGWPEKQPQQKDAAPKPKRPPVPNSFGFGTTLMKDAPRDAHGYLQSRSSKKDFDDLFGKDVTEQDIRSLVGVKDGKVYAYATTDGKELKVSAETDRIKTMYRTISKNADGELEIHNDLFFMHKDSQGGGYGTQVFADEVRAAANMGVSKIVTVGGRGRWMNGYSTWPKLGYDAKLPIGMRLSRELKAAKPQTIQDLLALPGGSEYWKKHGQQMEMTFDLTPGSKSLQILNKYLAAKGKPTIEVNMEQAEKAKADRKASVSQRKEKAANDKWVSHLQNFATPEEIESIRKSAAESFQNYQRDPSKRKLVTADVSKGMTESFVPEQEPSFHWQLADMRLRHENPDYARRKQEYYDRRQQPTQQPAKPIAMSQADELAFVSPEVQAEAMRALRAMFPIRLED